MRIREFSSGSFPFAFLIESGAIHCPLMLHVEVEVSRAANEYRFISKK